MTIYAGIDLGTSGIKIALVDEEGACVAEASRPCQVDRPYPGWSQQDPKLWWSCVTEIFDELAGSHPALMARLAAVSLSGQMLGTVFLGADDTPTTPCILWNDQRAIEECAELLERVPDIGWRTNGHPDPGLGAPKFLWLAKHQPAALDAATTVMLPKDYVRLCLTGERATDVSDASGTMLMDCATGEWDGELIAAAGWSRDKLPPLLKSWDQAGVLRGDLTARWGTPKTVLVAAGCGDNYAGALGIGASKPGFAALSIGTSGVLSAVDGAFHPAPDRAVLTTPHAAPGAFLSMGVVMSATQSLDWLATLTGTPAAQLAEFAEARIAEKGMLDMPLCRPSITGVRTPDNRPDAGGAFSGLLAVSDKVDLAYAIMEGVAFQFYDSYRAQKAANVPFAKIRGVGGGTRSGLWMNIIATLLDTEIVCPQDGPISACLGAAKLAEVATKPIEIDDVLARERPTKSVSEPRHEWRDQLLERHARFRELPF